MYNKRPPTIVTKVCKKKVQTNSVSECSAAEVREGILESGKADMWLGGLKGKRAVGKAAWDEAVCAACTCVHSCPAPSTEALPNIESFWSAACLSSHVSRPRV